MANITPRQEPVAAPTASGISGDGITAGVGSADSLVLNTNVPLATNAPSVPFVPTGGATLTITTSSEPAPSASQSATAAASSGERFSTGVVIAICVGAFAGAAIIIGIGIFMYRRSAPRNRRRAQPPNLSRSFSQDHGKFHADDDAWEGKYPPTPQTQQISPNVPPMEKLTMFKKSPSMRSEISDKSQDPFSDPESNFGEYNPTLSHLSTERSMADTRVHSVASSTHPFLDHVDTGPTLSWNMSFASSTDGGRMSPKYSRAIPTPQATATRLHHAQSAEVINFEGQTAEIVDPFQDSETHGIDRKKSNAGNPFFGSRYERESISVKRNRSRATSNASSRSAGAASARYAHNRSRSKAVSYAPSDNLDDMYLSEDEDADESYSTTSTANPFSDPSGPPMPSQPQPIAHLPLPGSLSHPYAAPIFRATPATPTSATFAPSPVTPINDPLAIKGLLDALDIGGQRNAQERDSRNTVASIGSTYSDDVSAAQFPIPPGAPRS